MKRTASEIGEEIVRQAKRIPPAARAHKVTAAAFVVGALLVLRVAYRQLGSLGHLIYNVEGHHWRQAFTYGVAWNYAHSALDFFKPRMFLELANSNIVGMEAPIYPFLGGLLLRVFRDSPFPLRAMSLASLYVIVGILWTWLGERRASAKEAWADRAALLVALAVCPEIGPEFRSIQPDPMCAALAVVAAFYLARYAETERPRDLLLGAVFTSVSVLTKPVSLGVVPALVLLAAYGKGRWLRRGVYATGALALALVPHILWDKWAQHLLKTEMNGLIVISIQHDPKEMIANLKNLGILREALLHFLPNYAGAWWLVPAIAAGVYRAFADARLRRFGVAFVVWILVYMVELIAFGDRLHSNAYYFVCAPAAVLFFAALGLGAFVAMLDSPDRRPKLVVARAGLLGLVLPLGVYLSNPADWAGVKELAIDKNRGVWTSDLNLGLLALCIVLALGTAAFLRPRRIPAWAGLPVLGLVLASAYLPWQHADQWFRYYDSTMARRGFPARVAALRAAVDKHSSREDRVVVDPPEMVLFSWVLRNGFGPGELKAEGGPARMKSRNTRLWVQFDGGGAAPKAGRLLETGPNFRVYCIADDDCR